MKKYLLVLSLILAFSGFSQCELITKAGRFTSTCFQNIYLGNSSMITECSVAIAKNGDTGFFLISKSAMPNEKFRGNIYLYLDDSNVITLVNREVQWTVNGVNHAQYNLTKSEIISLKNSNINSIRFWFCFSWLEQCDSATECYNKEFTDGLFNKNVARIDFPKLISTLFDNN